MRSTLLVHDISPQKEDKKIIRSLDKSPVSFRMRLHFTVWWSKHICLQVDHL